MLLQAQALLARAILPTKRCWHIPNLRLHGWFGLIDLTPLASGPVGVLALPVAVFEIILLPFWLLFRGFKTPEAPEHPAAE